MDFNDETVLWFGKYKGQRLIDVPDSYLLWLWEENEPQYVDGKMRGNRHKLFEYIEDNLDVLKK